MAAVAAVRATQTNEPGRCAALLPALAAVEGSIALLEVGAAAGLCLFPDRYGYRYPHADGTTELDPADGPSPVRLPCAIGDVDDIPQRVPEVVWRAGIDLNPLSADDPDAVAWLTALVWPEHEERRERLRAALALAATDPPRVVRGDATERLAEVAAEAPADASLVVFHTAVLAYLDDAGRRAFRDAVTALDAVWLANESPFDPPLPRHLRDAVHLRPLRRGVPPGPRRPRGRRDRSSRPGPPQPALTGGRTPRSREDGTPVPVAIRHPRVDDGNSRGGVRAAVRPRGDDGAHHQPSTLARHPWVDDGNSPANEPAAMRPRGDERDPTSPRRPPSPRRPSPHTTTATRSGGRRVRGSWGSGVYGALTWWPQWGHAPRPCGPLPACPWKATRSAMSICCSGVAW